MIRYFDSLPSTNAYAKMHFSDMADGDSIVARTQTAGRGRLGRSFLSPDGGLYMTYLAKPSANPDTLAVTGMAAVAVRRALIKAIGIEAKIKWTNDLILGGRKLSGILAESGFIGSELAYTVVGVGMNVNGTVPDEIADIATSIEAETGKKVDICNLAEAISTELAKIREANTAEYATEYAEHCITIGRCVTATANGVSVTGEAVGIDESFGLVIRTEHGNVTVASGEATLKNKKAPTEVGAR